MHAFHRWKYLDPEHRICSKCGECQLLYDPRWFWQTESRVTVKDADSSELQDRYWKPCLASELKLHMEIIRKELEEAKSQKEKEPERRLQAKLRKEREKEAAFALLKAHDERSVTVCRECGEKIVAGANFCTSCGKALFLAL